MAYRPQYPVFTQGFRQDLTYEQILREQIRECLECFNAGDRDGLERSLKATFALITPKIQDDQFREGVEKLNAEWKGELARLELQRQNRINQARNGCPDVVAKVSPHPSLDHLGRQLYNLMSLLERKKLGLKLEVNEQV